MSDRYAALDRLACALMETRPDLQGMSLDEWLATHRDRLTELERATASHILALYDEDRTAKTDIVSLLGRGYLA